MTDTPTPEARNLARRVRSWHHVLELDEAALAIDAHAESVAKARLAEAVSKDVHEHLAKAQQVIAAAVALLTGLDQNSGKDIKAAQDYGARASDALIDALAAYDARPAPEPEGREFTQEMIERGIAALGSDGDRNSAEIVVDVYRAMRAVRPEPASDDRRENR